MKNLFSIVVLCCVVFTSNFGQETDKSKFTIRMNNHLTRFFENDANMVKAREIYGHSCDKHHVVTEDEIKARAAEAEKHAFIHANMDEYMKLYFPQTANRSVTSDTFICDNGGFEDDFLYYSGFVSTFTSGSNTCTPNVPGWTPATLPTTNRFEIMTSGADPLVGIQKVKFGSKSLRINNRYGHTSQCEGNLGIDRVTKRFKVTEENRRFTVWYAVVLENPTGHANSSPFLNLKCDKAPADELCFDADFLKCAQSYSDPSCTFEKIDVVDWACHRFNIPASEIGNIATIEMIAADCGLSAHFGYAYIDGFCEPCTGSSLGSINLNGSATDASVGIEYYSCDGLTARVCGSYTLPTLCGTWSVDDIEVPGFTITNLSIDTTNKTFCFNFPISNFGANDCLDINAVISYNSSLGMNIPSQSSNTIKICKNLYTAYSYSLSVGSCNANGTSDFLSDDYYYITVTISDPDAKGWVIQRQLEDPYPGESGLYTMVTGSGSDVIVLGPFLIQEGCWDINISLPNCVYSEKICPPNFCSGCDAFAGLKISNVTCIPSTVVGVPDTWTFDIFVPGTGTYTIDGTTKTKGSTHTFPNPAEPLNQGCLTLEIETTVNGQPCTKEITICPPVPCSVRNCNLEIYPGKIICNSSGFEVQLNTNNTNLCYKIAGSMSSYSVPGSGVIGTFTGGVQVVVFDCSNPNCFKMIYLPKPNCDDDNIEMSQGRVKSKTNELNLKIVPNPFTNSQITIKSDQNVEQDILFMIYNNAGQLIQSGQFKGQEQTIPFDQPSGLYIIKFKNGFGHQQNYKFVKL